LHPVTKRLLGRLEAETIPRDLIGCKPAHVHRLEVPDDSFIGLGGARVDDEDDADVRARVDAEQTGDGDVQANFLPGLAHGAVCWKLADLEEAARERPEPAAGLDGALLEQDATAVFDDDRDDDARVDVVGVAAAFALEAVAILVLDVTLDQAMAAEDTMAGVWKLFGHGVDMIA